MRYDDRATSLRTLTSHWFPALIVGWLAAAAAAVAMATHAGAAQAAPPMVEAIIVKLQADTPADRQALATALGTTFAVAGEVRDGALQLDLWQPMTLVAARAAVNRARLLPQVVYANVAVAAREDAGDAANVAREALARHPPVTRFIVKYRDPERTNASIRNEGLPAAATGQLAALVGQPVVNERPMSGGAHVVRLFRALTAAEAKSLARSLEGNPEIEYFEPDLLMQPVVVPNDPLYPSQWNYQSPPSEMGGVNLPPAWDITTGSASVVSAVIDTGSLPGHPDLAGRYVGGYDFMSDPVFANDGNGRDSDPSDPGDWVTSAEGSLYGCAPHNSTFHGSHVAGILGAASNNATGVAGVNWVSKILPVRVLGKCGGFGSDIADAIRWSAGLSVPGVPANANPAWVLNLSLGGYACDANGQNCSCGNTFQNAINAAVSAGAVVVVAAGNSNRPALESSPGNCNGVITVAATGRQGQKASYSSYGSVVEISAPGGGDNQTILSTLNTSASSPDPLYNTYAHYAGTSMAAPHVTGIVSLMLSRNPSLTPAQVMSILQTTARPFPTGTVRDCTVANCGAGIVDAGAAVMAAGGTSQTTTTTTLASSLNPAPAGASVTFTATVTGTNPTGTVGFTDNGSAIAGCTAVALTGSGNSRTAACTTSSLVVGTHPIAASYAGDTGNLASTSAPLSQVITGAGGGGGGNVALVSAGGVASASSTYSSAYPVSAVNNNERAGTGWNSGGGWADGTPGAFPDSVQILFNGSKTIDRVVVYSLQDNPYQPVEPTDSTTFANYGITAFTVEGWNGTSWFTLATVSGNTLVKRTVTFAPATTDRIRINITAARSAGSYLTEIEAWTTGGGTSPTTTTLASSLNPAPAGASVTFTATVTGTNPTGNVGFTDNGSAIAGCTAVALTGSGNSRTAACTTSSLAVGTHPITASYGGDAGNTASASAPLSQVITGAGGGGNVALASAGGVASASSTIAGRSPASLNDNERAGINWSSAGYGGVWRDATADAFPDWVQIDFNGSKTIDRVVVVSPQDNYTSPVEPTDGMTFAVYGVRDYTVQGWSSDSTWITLATVTGNNLIKRTSTFAPFATERIRINVTLGLSSYSRLAEVEAWTAAGGASPTTTTLASSLNPAPAGASVTLTATVTGTNPTGTVGFTDNGNAIAGCTAVALTGSGNVRTAACATTTLAVGTHPVTASYAGDTGNLASTSAPLSQVITGAGGGGGNVALVSAGGVASASSTYSSAYPVSAVNNNERAGTGWNSGGGWADGTPGAFPDSVQILFNGSKTIDRVVVYSLQDNPYQPVEPTDSTTFANYGITAFTVEGWNGTSWFTLATVSGNTLVKRTVTFAPTTTDRIRINITAARSAGSYLTEIEAWTSGAP